MVVNDTLLIKHCICMCVFVFVGHLLGPKLGPTSSARPASDFSQNQTTHTDKVR